MNKTNNDAKLHRIEHLLRQMYRRYLRYRNLWIVYGSLGVLCAFLLLLVVAESYLFLPVWVKSISLIFALLLGSGLGLWILKASRPEGWTEFYRQISRAIQLEQLRNVLDLRNDEEGITPYSSLALKQNLDQISEEELAHSVKAVIRSNSFAKRHRQSGSIFLAVAIFLGILGFNNPGAINRITHFWKHYNRPVPFEFVVRPGSKVLEQGSPFQAILSLNGQPQPKDVKLALKTNLEKNFRIQKMSRLDDSTFVSGQLQPTVAFTYYVLMDGYKTGTFSIRILLRPRFEHLEAHVIPPAYTKLDPSSYNYPFTEFQAYPGSMIRFTGTLNKPVKSMDIIRFLTRDTLRDGLSGRIPSDSLDVGFSFKKADSLTFAFVDTANISNHNPYAVRIGQLKDENPYVSIIKPENVISMINPDTLSVQYEMSDDFGFHSVTLFYRVKKAFVGDQKVKSVRLPVPHTTKDVGQINWDLTKLDLKPLDQVTYWIQVRDNDKPSGYKKVQTSEHIIKMSSMAETLDQTDRQENSLTDKLEDLNEGANQIQQQFKQLQQNLRSGNQNSYKEQQSVEQLKKAHQEVNKKVDELNKQFEQLKKKYQKDHTLSQETLKKYQDLQKLIDEIKDPELMKALEKLQKSLRDMDISSLQQAMQKYQFNEKMYKERLERTLELFKSLKLDIGLDKTAKLLENLSKREGELLKKQATGKQKANEQQEIQKDLQKAKDKLNELNKQSPERAKGEMKKLENQMSPQFQQMQEMLQKNIQELNRAKPDMSRSSQQQRSIQNQLQKSAKEVRSARAKLNKKQVQLNIAALKSVLQDLILLSDAQEDVTRAVSDLSDQSPAFVEQARQQHTIKQSFRLVADSLSELSKEIPALSNQITTRKDIIQQNMDRALTDLSNRKQDVSQAQVQTVLGNMNELASMVASLLDQLEQQQRNGMSGGGMSMSQMMKQMQNMAGQQKNLNDQMQQLINDIHGNRLTHDQMSRLNQMARVQNDIRKQLKQLQEGGALESGDKMLSELQRMNEQMENAINDMRGGETDRQFIQRQHNILSRMLSAEKALEERGTDKKRRAEVAKEKKYAPPPNATLEQLKKYLRDRMSNENQTKYNTDYQRLIERYFEMLQKQLQSDSTGTPNS